MLVLGLHKDPWHNTGACAVREDGGKFSIAMLSEERLDRLKDSRAFPHHSAMACLREVGAHAPEECDSIILDHIVNKSDWRKDQFRRSCSNVNFLAEVDQSKIEMINHHLAHACSVFYSSPFSEAAVLVVDGRGSDRETQSLFHATEDGIRLITSTSKIGIGLLYAAVTQAIKFGLLQEGKTMGLAPFGKTNSQLFNFGGRFDGIVTDYEGFCIDGSYDIAHSYEPLDSFEKKADAAFAVQAECERAMLHLARFAKEQTGAKYLCITGGVALNSVSNYRILESGLFEDIFINPAASDTGIPLGCALYGYYTKGGRVREEISPYLGPTYSDAQIEDAINRFDGYEIVRASAVDRAIDLLAANKIVARFEGRSEMGPRALGHRSILMSPLLAENKDVLNARVKFRESFRPFAPIVLEDRASEFFEIDRPCPYMLLIPPVRKEMRSVVPAITHVDGTARLQTVTRERNGNLYDILQVFGERTGVPVLLNTSFNIANEPIVESPVDAIKCFMGTDIDALLIEDILLLKI
ncbi:carbamoyltransferase C-terminal domain-containing protein [Flaviflagellibacter deserti]|uniref:Carbamoyltransferase n=1 Tax=Flaviflagellibacter deserti TaxID=2267266 RepID=A0ABV9YYS1_9HYPH